MIKFIASSLIASSLIFAQEPSAFNAGGSAAQKTEVEILNERLFKLSTQVKNIEESQEGLKSVFEGQLQRVQDVVSRIELLKGENNAAITEVINKADSNFSLQNENIEKIKQSISALGALIKKTNAQMQAEIDELKDKLKVLEKSEIKTKSTVDNEVDSNTKTIEEVKEVSNSSKDLAVDVLIGNIENNATQELDLFNTENVKSSFSSESSSKTDKNMGLDSKNINENSDRNIERVQPKISKDMESVAEKPKNDSLKQEDLKVDNLKKRSLADVFKEGEQFYKNKSYERADEYLRFAVKGNYKPARGNYLLGEIAFEQKRYEDAIYYYKTSATRYDKAEYMPRLMLHSAKSFIALKEEDNAKRFLETLVTLYPKSNEAREAKKLIK